MHTDPITRDDTVTTDTSQQQTTSTLVTTVAATVGGVLVVALLFLTVCVASLIWKCHSKKRLSQEYELENMSSGSGTAVHSS